MKPEQLLPTAYSLQQNGLWRAIIRGTDGKWYGGLINYELDRARREAKQLRKVILYHFRGQ